MKIDAEFNLARLELKLKQVQSFSESSEIDDVKMNKKL